MGRGSNPLMAMSGGHMWVGHRVFDVPPFGQGELDIAVVTSPKVGTVLRSMDARVILGLTSRLGVGGQW